MSSFAPRTCPRKAVGMARSKIGGSPVFASLLLASVLAQPQPGTVVPLWHGKAPLAVGDSDLDKPSVAVYLASKEKVTGAAVVICPGGGYGFLAADHERKQIAEFFNSHGVHA